MPSFRAISIKQPWLNLILGGHKTIETRTKISYYRGPLILHASKSPRIAPCGCALAVVDMVDCRVMTKNDWPRACLKLHGAIPRMTRAAEAIVGRPPKDLGPRAVTYGYVFENLRFIEPVAMSGGRGIYPVELPELSFLD